ncbi:sulfate transport system permease protein [Endobacter medicaginis]|jgi:sulfate/thiosulfate transport system permease protein|uniref:Sulfate transport system permease protein n=2 Tax=Endobacter medicaginis TaxID=1181271 RepID=A0A839UVD2_9PROT|nr:sulfate ABC transporter permease subunit [Endobacter medicaginis]MBB3173767.1 sulfate transport system permease protein [Endobacter medicaginis]MCX5474954.1 sulfate ABC transporter permease subunit [Endobacter medicaginis]
MSRVRDRADARDWLVMAAACAIVGVLLIAPLVLVFVQAFADGWRPALEALREPETLSAIRLTLFVAVIVVAVNSVFGTIAAWLLARFDFRFKAALLTLIELPVSISPVIGGLVWLLLFGAQGWFGPWCERHGIGLMFAWPGIVLATLFVTFPYVVRTALPLLEAQGPAQEEAAVLLGAGWWSLWARVILPGMRLALLSGVLLTTARALGEFGAVAVVSGHIPGLTNTMPLEIETLYNGYRSTAAFALSATLALMALAVIALRTLIRRAGSVRA